MSRGMTFESTSGQELCCRSWYTGFNGKGKRMDWIQGLQRAIDYMEAHLCEDINYEEIAGQAYSSSFHFQRIFHMVCGYTVGEYIRARRLSRAGNDLMSGQEKVIDIALKYGYGSPESFCRAFTRFHGITPSQVKRGDHSIKSFSRVSVKLMLEGGNMMDYRIEKREAFQVIARRAKYEVGGEIGHEQISATWVECTQDGTIETLASYLDGRDSLHGGVLGISFADCREGGFDYALGVLYEGGRVPEGLTLEDVPAGTWAVFPCTGKMPEAFRELWKKIYTEFFPSGSYQPAGGMCIEVYPSAYIDREDYCCEIWLSVEEK